MNKENDSIALMVAPVHDLMFHHLSVALAMLRVAKDSINLSADMAYLYIESVRLDPSCKPSRSILHSRKSLKATLLEIDKLIKKVELDCDSSVKNSSMNYNTNKVTDE